MAILFNWKLCFPVQVIYINTLYNLPTLLIHAFKFLAPCCVKKMNGVFPNDIYHIIYKIVDNWGDAKSIANLRIASRIFYKCNLSMFPEFAKGLQQRCGYVSLSTAIVSESPFMVRGLASGGTNWVKVFAEVYNLSKDTHNLRARDLHDSLTTHGISPLDSIPQLLSFGYFSQAFAICYWKRFHRDGFPDSIIEMFTSLPFHQFLKMCKEICRDFERVPREFEGPVLGWGKKQMAFAMEELKGSQFARRLTIKFMRRFPKALETVVKSLDLVEAIAECCRSNNFEMLREIIERPQEPLKFEMRTLVALWHNASVIGNEMRHKILCLVQKEDLPKIALVPEFRTILEEKQSIPSEILARALWELTENKEGDYTLINKIVADLEPRNDFYMFLYETCRYSRFHPPYIVNSRLQNITSNYTFRHVFLAIDHAEKVGMTPDMQDAFNRICAFAEITPPQFGTAKHLVEVADSLSRNLWRVHAFTNTRLNI